jgi:acyl carrier protein
MRKLKAVEVEKLDELVSEWCNVIEPEISSESKLKEDLWMDSLDKVELMMEVDNYFKISILDEKQERIKTYGELVLAVEELLS